jgi:hypothetical protein
MCLCIVAAVLVKRQRRQESATGGIATNPPASELVTSPAPTGAALVAGRGPATLSARVDLPLVPASFGPYHPRAAPAPTGVAASFALAKADASAGMISVGFLTST